MGWWLGRWLGWWLGEWELGWVLMYGLFSWLEFWLKWFWVTDGGWYVFMLGVVGIVVRAGWGWWCLLE